MSPSKEMYAMKGAAVVLLGVRDLLGPREDSYGQQLFDEAGDALLLLYDLGAVSRAALIAAGVGVTALRRSR